MLNFLFHRPFAEVIYEILVQRGFPQDVATNEGKYVGLSFKNQS